MAGRLLALSKTIEKRLWGFESPLRQFPQISHDIHRKLEARRLSIDRLREMDSREIGESLCLTYISHHSSKFIDGVIKFDYRNGWAYGENFISGLIFCSLTLRKKLRPITFQNYSFRYSYSPLLLVIFFLWHGSWSTLAQVMVYCLMAPMSTAHRWGLMAFSWGQFHKKCSKYISLSNNH